MRKIYINDKKNVGIAIIINFLLIFFDQYTKNLAVKILKNTEIDTIEIINNILNFTYVENTGAAYGMMDGFRGFFLVFTVFALAVIMYYYIKLPISKINFWIRWCLVFICAGAIGNFLDRLLNGYVVDFIQVRFIDFPIFNFADIYVVLGTFTLSFILIFFMKDDKVGCDKNAKKDN